MSSENNFAIGKALLEQAESYLTETDFFKHGKLSFIKQISAFLRPTLNIYKQLSEADKDEIISLFEKDLEKQLIRN